MAEKLTPQQELAVNNRGGNLLVSAAAGSGKTKVLTERLMSYILDPVDPANVDEFLIITFTKAAAAELRSKIGARISKEIAKQPHNQHLHRQMQRLHMAQISTVHSFCTEILRQYAYRLDVAADFRMLDEAESPELQQRVLDQVLNHAYETIHENDAFRQLIDSQGFGRNDLAIPELVLKVYENSRCHLDPEGWLRRCGDGSVLEGCDDLSQTPWGEYLIDDLHKYLDLQIATMSRCADAANKTEGIEKVAALLEDNVAQLMALRNLSTWDEIVGGKQIEYGTMRFPKTSVDKELEEQLKATRNACKKGLEEKLEAFDVLSREAISDLRSCAIAIKGLVDLVREFAAQYDRLKKSHRLMDFSDLEHRTLDLIMGKDRFAPNGTAREIGRRYREVMVDEYQDSNQVQDAIYKALTAERNNCFMVGDVKQSIYQFRLADPSIFIRKYDTYLPAEEAAGEEGRKILLSSNFRSSKGVIDGVNAVFSRCMNKNVGGLDYGNDEALREGIPHSDLDEPDVQFYAVDVQEDTYDEEARFVASKILQLLDGKHMVRDGDAQRPIQPEDIVILLRSPKSMGAEFKFALESAGIPCTTNDAEDLLEAEEISVLISLLRVIRNPLQDIPLLSVLASNVFCYSADELAYLRNLDKQASIFRLLELDSTEKSKSFLRVLSVLRNEARICTISQLLNRIMEETGFDCIYSAMTDGTDRAGRIQNFLQLADSFESSGGRDLQRFIEHIDALKMRGYAVPGDETASAVRIMSIHKSKGLEYPVVILSGLSRRTNFQNAYEQVLCDKQLGLGLYAVDQKRRLRYPTVAKKAISVKAVTETISEELRILYVAMTRARDRLIMTFADDSLEGTIQKLSMRMRFSENSLLSGYVSMPGIWVLQTALLRTEAGALFQMGGNPGCSTVSEIPWTIEVVSAPDSVEAAEIFERELTCDCEMVDRLRVSLSYHYPYSDATTIPSKQTATQLKGRLKDTEVADRSGTDNAVKHYYRKPTFAGGGIAGKEYGNAYHAVMQYIRYGAYASEEALRRELERLCVDNLITKEQYSMVSHQRIYRFLQSPLGKRIADAKQIYREFKFSILTDATNENRVLLQGVVDCMIVDPDGIVIVDFKSERLDGDSLEAHADAHREQVMLYAQAVERIFGMPVKEKVLYFFHADTAVAL